MLRSLLNIVVFVAKLSSLRQSAKRLVKRNVLVALVAWWLCKRKVISQMNTNEGKRERDGARRMNGTDFVEALAFSVNRESRPSTTVVGVLAILPYI